jgi:hypothetical protein
MHSVIVVLKEVRIIISTEEETEVREVK